MRIQRVSELVMAFIGVRIGIFRRAQQRNRSTLPFGVIPVLAIVQQAESVLAVGDVGPAICGNLKLRLFCRSIARRRTLHGAKWNFVRRLIAVRAQRERDLQQNVFLVPLRLHFHIDAGNPGIQA